MTRLTPEQFSDMLCAINRDAYIGRATMEPKASTLLAERPDGEMELIVVRPWRNNVEKKLLLGAVKRRLNRMGAVRYAFVNEAWVAMRKWSDQAGPMPSEDPNRIEVVMTLIVEPGRPFQARHQRIVRDKAGVVTDLIEEDTTGYSERHAFGALGELLNEPTTEH